MDSAKPSVACDVTQTVATISTSSFDTPGATILATSAAVAFLIFLTTGPVHFSDSSTYFAYSIAMSHFTVDTDAWFRTAGYPLLITATLYPWTFSMIGVLAVQALFAALIPWLIYRILLYARSTPFAVFGALLRILTLLPYQFQNLLYSDQAEMFLGILFCYLLIRFQFSPNTKNMIWMFLAYAYVSFFRPPSLLLYLLLLLVVGVAAWSDRRKRFYYLKPFAALSMGVGCLFVCASALNSYLYAQIDTQQPSMMGRTVFFNPFVDSVGVEGAFQDGTHTKLLRNKLLDFFREAPPNMRDFRYLRPQIADRFNQYQSQPEEMVNALMRDRTVNTFWAIFVIANVYFGDDHADSLFMSVAVEQYRLHPIILCNVIEIGLLYYLGLRGFGGPPSFFPFTFISEHDNGYAIVDPQAGMATYASRILGERAADVIVEPVVAYATEIFPRLFTAILPLAAAITGLGIVIAIFGGRNFREGSPELPVFLTALSVYLFYVGPMMLLVNPQFRYVVPSVLLLVISALISLRMLLLAPLS